MRYPNFIPNPALLTDETRIFRPGEDVEITQSPLPIGQNGDVFGLPGPVPADALMALTYAVEIVHRIAPWAVVYAVPTLVIAAPPNDYPCREVVMRKDCGRNYVKAGGLSFDKEGFVALSLASSAVYLIETAYHEAWHQIERILDKNILDEIDSCLVPMSWGSDYLDSMFERRARCFQTWCMHYEEGMPSRGLATWIDEIFDAVATGEVSREWTCMQEKAGNQAARGRSR